jgi:hypothetical protein
MKTADIIPGMGEGVMKENDGNGEFSYEVL